LRLIFVHLLAELSFNYINMLKPRAKTELESFRIKMGHFYAKTLQPNKIYCLESAQITAADLTIETT